MRTTHTRPYALNMDAFIHALELLDVCPRNTTITDMHLDKDARTLHLILVTPPAVGDEGDEGVRG